MIVLLLARRYGHLAAIGLLALLLGIQTQRITLLKRDIAQRAAEVAQEYTRAAARVISRERAAARISDEKALSHEKSIADLRAAAARRLQAYAGKPTALPGVPDAPVFTHEGAGGSQFCIETSAAVALMLAADENTRQLVELQAWFREQMKAAQ